MRSHSKRRENIYDEVQKHSLDFSDSKKFSRENLDL
jgi:hypothetical protein